MRLAKLSATQSARCEGSAEIFNRAHGKLLVCSTSLGQRSEFCNFQMLPVHNCQSTMCNNHVVHMFRSCGELRLPLVFPLMAVVQCVAPVEQPSGIKLINEPTSKGMPDLWHKLAAPGLIVHCKNHKLV